MESTKTSAETKTRIAHRAAADTGVTWAVCFDVLWKNGPIHTAKREKVWRWAVSKRLFSSRDLVMRPPRKRKKPTPSTEPLREGLEVMVEQTDATVARAVESELEAAHAARAREASAEFDRIVAGLAAREGR